jgi:hypothetical protein
VGVRNKTERITASILYITGISFIGFMDTHNTDTGVRDRARLAEPVCKTPEDCTFLLSCHNSGATYGNILCDRALTLRSEARRDAAHEGLLRMLPHDEPASRIPIVAACALGPSHRQLRGDCDLHKPHELRMHLPRSGRSGDWHLGGCDLDQPGRAGREARQDVGWGSLGMSGTWAVLPPPQAEAQPHTWHQTRIQSSSMYQ